MKTPEHWFDCEHPKQVRNKYTGQIITVPCGRCHACMVKRMTKWVAPLIRESQVWKHSYFITLTYNEHFLPLVDLSTYRPNSGKYEAFKQACASSREFIELYKGVIPYCPSSDIQNFIKRFRENVFRSTGKRCCFRYFFSSDYGSTLFRPHWHGIIFTSDPFIASNIETLVNKSWSLYDKTRNKRHSIGITQSEPSFGCSQYVASYIQAIDHLPAIYNFKDFRPRHFHSSAPPLGSVFRSVESLEEIVREGLSEVTIYDPKTFTWHKTALLPHLVRRLFPTVPSFTSLSRVERFSLYRIFDRCTEFDFMPSERRTYLRHVMTRNSWFYDYVTLRQSNGVTPDLSFKQINDKLDRIYYAFMRLYTQASAFNVSVYQYDDYIVQFLNNRINKSFKKQYEHAQRQALVSNSDYISCCIDLDYHYPDGSRPLPSSIDSSYFRLMDEKYNKFVKRKCDNAYLERHPEFKQFHS